LWAPAQQQVCLALEGEAEALRMERGADGWHELDTFRARAGTRYRYQLTDGMLVPDPASHFQPDDVMGPSEVIDHAAHRWADARWRGRPWHTAVIYELHVGAFTAAGTFAAIIERLPHLASLGITAIELMPIGDFPGRYNWGYDGVLPFAPDATCGRPESLKALIDAAHERGLMVLLDVVYNHFGPEGNFLGLYAPEFFTQRHHTPWGAAVNFDGERTRAVRDFVIENALYWLEEFHFDGLRLDAVHHLIDDSPQHILEELAETVPERLAGRQVHLILENEENQASRLRRDSAHAPVHYTAQWNDDLHHVLHTAATGEAHGYYQDYRADDVKLGRALAEGFAFQGEVMSCRGSARGEPTDELPPVAFVAFLQNHDQIGNRAFGERLGRLAAPAALRAVNAIYLLLPQIPLLFMGEEWNAAQPFVFFCDFKGELAAAIREGRRKEFAAFPAFSAQHPGQRIPDPDDPATFTAAKLDWRAADSSECRAAQDRYRSLLGVRQREIIPRIPLIGSRAASIESLGAGALRIQWRVGEEILHLMVNLNDASVAAPASLLWAEGGVSGEGLLLPWTVLWSIHSET
jgi:maltooligosyltrehalose trehalohydrolase